MILFQFFYLTQTLPPTLEYSHQFCNSLVPVKMQIIYGSATSSVIMYIGIYWNIHTCSNIKPCLLISNVDPVIQKQNHTPASSNNKRTKTENLQECSNCSSHTTIQNTYLPIKVELYQDFKTMELQNAKSMHKHFHA